MKRLLLILTILLPLWVAAQEGYAGRDFWATSVINPFFTGPDSAVLYLVGDTACGGYVENPNSAYYQTFSVSPGQPTIIKIPKSEIQFDFDSSSIQTKGVHISTTHDVYAYLQSSNTDIFQNYPTSSIPDPCPFTKKHPLIPSLLLGDQYHIPQRLLARPGEMLLVATENGTQIDCGPDGILFLNKGEVAFLQRQSSAPSFFLSTNCKKIAVFNVLYNNFNLGYSSMSHFLFGGPRLTSSHLFDGKDYIVKKSGNKRFAKSMYLNGVMPYYMSVQLATIIFRTIYVANQLNIENGGWYFYGNTRNMAHYLSYCDPDTPPFLCDVPYVFFRYSNYPQPYCFIYEISRELLFNMLYSTTGPTARITNHKHLFDSWGSIIPNDVMVKKWVIPTTRRNVTILNGFIDYDTTFAELDIYVHENGLHSTYLNGQLLPASAFDSVPFTNRDYWVAQIDYYNDSIPEIIRVENPNGFSAYLDEFGYTPFDNPMNYIYLHYWHENNSGVNFETAPVEHSNLSPHNRDTVYRCLGDTLHLDVEYNPDSLEFDWIVDGITHYNTRTLDIPITDFHTITAQLIIHYLCPDTTTTFVRVVLPPVIPFSSDTILCAGATLSAENPDALLYNWSTGETTPAITIDSAGIYSVTVANRGCTASLDSFRVELYEPSHVDFGQDTTLCNLATLLLDATQTHPATYEWQDHSTNTTYLVVNDGHYWVIVTDHCLGASDTIDVDYLHDFEVNLGTDTTLCEGDELVLSANLPFCTYRWQDGSTEPRFVVRQPGSYSVTATNLCYSHNDDIDIDYEPCAQELWMPNAFTPNGDGLNDRLLPVFGHPDEIEDFEMMVYDRWGSMVFLTKDMHTGWDGGNLPRGMYVWVIRYKSAREEEHTVKGSVMLGR